MTKVLFRSVCIVWIVLWTGPVRSEPDWKVIAEAIVTIRELDRPGRDSLAAVWDGNKYVQCRHTVENTIRCEAGGSLMQSSLERVLTPARIDRLTARGWVIDPSFGNYVQVFAATTPPETIADDVIAALAQGYDADVEHLAVETTSIKREPCPPRNGPSQNLAGLINDAASMALVAIHACTYRPADNGGPRKLGPDSTVADLVALYGPSVTAEVRRLRINLHREVFTVFDAGLGYIQCRPRTDPDGLLCEAQSADSWPELAALLTPAHIDRLHAAGFADPGRGPNYAKIYPITTGDAALAAEILSLLHDVYGYRGSSRLHVITEEN